MTVFIRTKRRVEAEVGRLAKEATRVQEAWHEPHLPQADRLHLLSVTVSDCVSNRLRLSAAHPLAIAYLTHLSSHLNWPHTRLEGRCATIVSHHTSSFFPREL